MLEINLPLFTITTPPLNSLIKSIANFISSLFIPATIKLWASWPTLLATAPSFKLNFLIKP